MAIPGLSQTGEYTRALMIECGHAPEDEVEDRMVTLLRRAIGGPYVLRRQLEFLVEIAHIGSAVLLWDSKRTAAGPITISPIGFKALLADIRPAIN